MLKLTENDRSKIRTLLKASTEVKNMMKLDDINSVFSGDPKKLMASMLAAQGRENVVRLHSAHLVVYDILMEGGVPMEHLSVSHPKGPVVEPDMITIATEFGMGDRATWSMHMPPIPPMRAYHIMRKIG